MDLRNYIKAVEETASRKNNFSPKLNDWLKWVKGKADWYDPLIEKEDELFRDIDRDTLDYRN
jgi:hypothetical protein